MREVTAKPRRILIFFRCHREHGRAVRMREPIRLPPPQVGRRSHRIDYEPGILPDCVWAEHHYLCGGEAPHGNCNQSTPGHAKDVPFASNDGFEIRVCPTWWKRVSWLSEMHARLRAPA